MKNSLEEYLYEISDILELQECLSDVFENSMYQDKSPSYALTLLNIIKNKTENLYENLDMFCLKLNNDWSFMFFSYNWKYEI